ncbi:MAG: hypothetical protein JKX79_12370 [Labilibaculum sp.]|nr:hypothetical protein [Labilibaculum sp.]
MKNKNPIFIMFSGILLTIGIFGFAISPFLFDSEISEIRTEISDFEYRRQLAHINLSDGENWWKYAGTTANTMSILLELNAPQYKLDKRKIDYFTESKFSLNCFVIAAECAKGNFDIDVDSLMKKWDGISSPEEIFALQTEYVSIAHSELENLEKNIKNNKGQINHLETNRKWFWIICIIVQTLGMFIGIYHSYIKETNDK